MGYRMRMTLAFGLLAFLSVAVLTLLFLISSYHEFRADRMGSVERLTSCLAGNIYWDMQAGDNQRLGEALERFSRGVPSPTPPGVFVLTPDRRVYASSGLDSVAAASATPLPGQFDNVLDRMDAAAPNTVMDETSRSFLSAAPIARDGKVLGTVLVDYPFSSLRQHFASLFKASVVYSFILLLVLLAIGWMLGKQLVHPITRLRECMRRVGKGDLDVHCDVVESRDEIGELAQGLEEMLGGLREKRLLEQKIRQSERLAAIGQVAAGVAHEINNPLGGMLNAVNTFKRHGQDEEVASRTLDLLERGLRQIQNTVQALLLQSRVEEHPLSKADIEDIRTLITVEVRNKNVMLDWQCELDANPAQSSSAIRYILINLLLNAIKAVKPGGRVSMLCRSMPAYLLLRVGDDGAGIPAEGESSLFEPFVSSTGGNGLGLWFTHQTVEQLGGSIEIKPASPGTLVEVRLPDSQHDRKSKPGLFDQENPV